MNPKIDGLLLAEYRRHAASYNNPPCGCSIEGPDRDCDVGWSLYQIATRNREPVHQDCMLAMMR
jgi:hypothetical protein